MKKCPKCSADLNTAEETCPACGQSTKHEFAETAIKKDDEPDHTPTRLKETVPQEATSDGSRFVPGTVLAHRYRIINLLGKGGMGEVYKAEDLELKQTVALKFLPENLSGNEELLERFRGEVRNARQVSHPNVCRVFDIGETEGLYYLTMEFIEGDDLSMLLNRIGRLPSDKAVETSRQICLGLNAVHKAGILHRDLKPANIIIDSKGEARITDFGIAGLEADVQGAESKVGTPAYMSPEQITGKEVTQKSDIYSLGLLIYEIFTGKQAVKGDSLDDLIEKHKTTNPTNPSEFVENIDPLVERIISRCLEKKPNDRPASAVQVALALPGGNSLEVALEAGETPSPEMVAAAPKKGALKPFVAASLLLGIIVAMAAIVFLNAKYKSYNIVPLEKSNEVLAERAKSILGKVDYTDFPENENYKFAKDASYMLYVLDNQLPQNFAEKFAKGQPLGIYFWYRRQPKRIKSPKSRIASPASFEHLNNSESSVPIPGTFFIKLDPIGRLVELNAVPAEVKKAENNPAQANWRILFEEAGLDINKFKDAETPWIPPFYSDSKKSWEGFYADFPDIPIQIEASSLDGKPVYFRIFAPWDKRTITQDVKGNVFTNAMLIVLFFVYALTILVALFFAWRNLKAGRGDLKGALKLAIFIFVTLFLSEFLVAQHSSDFESEFNQLFGSLGNSILKSFHIFVVYIALEPFVRRWWSELLISWTRLLAGEFRDPMIGRDILVGGLLGLTQMFFVILANILIMLVTGNEFLPNDEFQIEVINGIDGTIGVLLFTINLGFNLSLTMLFLLLIFYMIFRKKWISILSLFIIYIVLVGLGFSLSQHWVFLLSLPFVSFISIYTLIRHGLLGSISATFFVGIWFLPNTIDPSRFYFLNGLLVIATILAISIYAFYISIAGQPIFGGNLLKGIED